MQECQGTVELESIYCILEIEDTLWTVENIFVRNAESIFIMKTDWGANGRSEKWQYFRTIEHLISNKPHYTIRHRDKGHLYLATDDHRAF